jgi:outer membrane protein assembly factor BamB
MTIGLALLVVLALNLTLSSVTHMAVHATPARASITLSKVTGPPTTTLTVEGTGFGSSETVITTFNTTTIVGSTRTSRLGSFSLGITIPATALPGRQSIQATGRRSGLTGSRTFLVNTNWSQFGYDQAHSRTNPYENVLSRTNVSHLTLDWRYTTGNYIDSSPAVTNGVVYIGSEDHNVYALDAKTGTRLWSYTTGSFILSSPAVVNGVVYIGSTDDNVYAFHLPGTQP